MEFTVSADALIRLFPFLLYVPVCLFVYWKLIPRLSPTAKLLASVFLAAQVLVIVLALEIRPFSNFSPWLWYLHEEWNIPSTLASMQLFLVSGVALVTAWLAKVRSAWQRFYLVAIGLVFLFLAWDEYFKVHEGIPNWERYYAALGAVVAAATVAVAIRSPRRMQIWRLCLLTGLAMSGVGAIFFELLPPICDNLGFLRLDKCLYFFWFEEMLEFLGIWLALVALLGHFSDAVPTPKPRIRRLLYAMPALWILLLFLNSLIPRLELRLLAQPASVQFETGIHLYGYHIGNAGGGGGELVQLYASGRPWNYIFHGYSVHLVDQISGESIASRDEWADRRHGFWLFGPDYMSIYRQSMELEIPPQAAANRALWLVLALWRKQSDEFVFQKVLASDLQLLNETQVVLDELILPAVSTAAPPATPIALFNNGFTLDAVDLPERAQPGETLTIPFTWRSDVAGDEDHVQFLHFGHEESGAWWVHDQQPLGPRLPTRLWYNGLADSEIWQVPLPADLAPGRYAIYTGLYRARDLERLPASSADGRPWPDARVPLGSLMIEE